MSKKQPSTETTYQGETLDGIDQLVRSVRLFANCGTDWCHQWTAAELLKIARAYRACAWDVPPDEWHPEQAKEAIRSGAPPEWDEHGHPVFLGKLVQP